MALGIALLALVISCVTLGMTLAGSGQGSLCGETEWKGVPAATALPAGWTESNLQYYLDGSYVTLTPAPSSAGATASPVYASIQCIGSDASKVLTLARQGAVGQGNTEIGFPAIGDESFATQTSGSASTLVYFRRGSIVVQVSVYETSLDAITTASKLVDASLQR